MTGVFSWFLQNPSGEADQSFGDVEYEDRVVVFVDLLGWRSLVQETRDSKVAVSHLGFVLGLFGKAESGEYVLPAGFLGHVPPTFQATQFSDTVVMSWVYRDGVGTAVAGAVSALYSSVLNYGLLLRGSILRGPLFHRSNLIFGPALADAYDMERKGAIYPRIVLSDDLAAEFGRGAKILDETKNVSALVKSWRRDLDGRVFYDFAQPFGAMQGLLPSAPSWTNSIDFFANYVSHINYGLRRFADSPRELRKYVWFGCYFNDVTSEYPEKGARPIDLTKFPNPFHDTSWQ